MLRASSQPSSSSTAAVRGVVVLLRHQSKPKGMARPRDGLGLGGLPTKCQPSDRPQAAAAGRGVNAGCLAERCDADKARRPPLFVFERVKLEHYQLAKIATETLHLILNIKAVRFF